MFNSIGEPVLSIGFSFLIYNDSKICRSALLVVATILKFLCCMGCPVCCECSRTAEKGGADNGRLVLMETALCSPTLHENWRRVDPK